MANEITASATLRVVKNSTTLCDIRTGNVTFTFTGDEESGGTQIIGFAAHEVLAVSADVGSGGWSFFKNLDGTNYLELGIDAAGTFHALLKLLPGEFALGRVTTNAVYAKANTAACKLFYRIFEN